MSRIKQPSIEIEFCPKGEIRIDAVNYSGSSCEEATRYLEQALGLASNRQRKTEFYQRHNTRNHLNPQRT